MMDQRTPPKPVSEGHARQWDRMGQDFVANYPGGSEKAELAKSHPDVKARFHAFLDQLAAEKAEMNRFGQWSVWATIQVGTLSDNAALRRILLYGGNLIGDWGDDVLAKIVVASEPGEYDLVVVSNADLGYAKGCTRTETYAAGLARGWELCSAEDAAQYLIQHGGSLAMNEWVLFAMEPIMDSGGRLKLFSVARSEEGRWLFGDDGHPAFFWRGERRWAFRRKRPAA